MHRTHAIAAGLTVTLMGCRAEPAPDAGFVESPERMAGHAEIPFHKVWIKPGVVVRDDFRKLHVAEVNTDYLLEMGWFDKQSKRITDGEFERDVEELARFTRTSIERAFYDDPNGRFEVVPEKGAGVAVLEMALIEVIPSKAVLHAIGWLPPIGTGAMMSYLNPRTVAFEARIRDGATGEVIATFADREQQPAGPLDVTRLTWYGPAEGIIEGWSSQFVALANRAPGEVVEDSGMYTLRPW